jgi:hypothetical protein
LTAVVLLLWLPLPMILRRQSFGYFVEKSKAVGLPSALLHRSSWWDVVW